MVHTPHGGKSERDWARAREMKEVRVSMDFMVSMVIESYAT